MATLVLDRISKSFGDIQALKSVSFDCNEGEFLVIVGPSGAGKSTTLNCVAGIEYPEYGSIYIGDQDVTMLAPQERNVAMVFETYALYPQLTVYDNLAFPLRSPRYREEEDEIDRRVTSVAALLGISPLLERLPKQLSQGQRQRVSLGRALVRKPEVYLFDEPISHLDAKLRNAMRRELKRIRNELKQTSVYVTHDYLEALSLADRVVVLYEGEVLQFDFTRAIYNQPAAVEVGQLFGDLPMIFFDGKIDETMHFVDDANSFRLATNGVIDTRHANREVKLGLRPTDIQLVSYEDGDLQGEVYSVQNQFDSQLITVKAHGRLIDIVVYKQAGVGEGDKAGVRVPAEICYFFDRETRRAL